MDIGPYTIIKAFALPPGIQSVAGIVGLLLYRRARMLGLTLLVASSLSMWVLAMPATADWLARPLEYHAPIEPAALAAVKADAIVVLAGGIIPAAPEFKGEDDVSRLTLERVRYGARLHRATGLPLAVSGGFPLHAEYSESELMQRTLEADFEVPVSWVESESRNTAENARFSRQYFPFDTVVLVTHAVHMPRSVRAFEDAGFKVIPAPMGFVSRPGTGFAATDFLPSLNAYYGSVYAFYEMLAAVWYRWAYD